MVRADGRTYVPEYSEYRRRQRAARLKFLQAHPRDIAHGRRSSYDCGCRCKKCSNPAIRAPKTKEDDQ